MALSTSSNPFTQAQIECIPVIYWVISEETRPSWWKQKNKTKKNVIVLAPENQLSREASLK